MASGWQEEGTEHRGGVPNVKTPGPGADIPHCSQPFGGNPVTGLHLTARDAGSHSPPVGPGEERSWVCTGPSLPHPLFLLCPGPSVVVTALPSTHKFSTHVIFSSWITLHLLPAFIHSPDSKCLEPGSRDTDSSDVIHCGTGNPTQWALWPPTNRDPNALVSSERS